MSNARTTPTIRHAEKRNAKLRLALIGPSGSGKTFTALRVASALGKRVLVIDSEAGSSEKYADKFSFDVIALERFDPRNYIEAVRAGETGGYDVIIVDSLSHAWAGPGGLLEMVDDIAVRGSSGGNPDTHSAWREATPIQNSLISALIRSSAHVIATMRTKVKYSREKNSKGKTEVKKIGLAPVQREGVDHEFDVVGALDQDNRLHITKTRCSDLAKAVIKEPGEALGEQLRAWLQGAPALNDGEPAKAPAPAPALTAVPPPPPAPPPAAPPAPKAPLPPEVEAFRPLYAEFLALVGMDEAKRVWNRELGNLVKKPTAELIELLPKARAIVAAARPAAEPLPWEDDAPPAPPANVTPIRDVPPPPPEPRDDGAAGEHPTPATFFACMKECGWTKDQLLDEFGWCVPQEQMPSRVVFAMSAMRKAPKRAAGGVK